MKDIENAINSIKIDNELKEKIYNNIIQMAKTENTVTPVKVIRPNFKRYVPYIAACFIFVISAILIMPRVNSNPDFSRSRQNSIMAINEETIDITAYKQGDNGLISCEIKDCSQDPVAVWNRMKEVGFANQDSELLYVSYYNDSVILNFNNKLEPKDFDAVIKTFEQVFPNTKVNILTE